MSGITKSFGPVVALRGVDLAVEPRQVHGLLGGNGAGKTTLMNVLYGLYAADAGTIEIEGRQVDIRSPRDAIGHGVGMVHQSFLQVESYTVTENVVLGTPAGRGRLDLRPARRRIRELSETFGLDVDADAVVSDLPVGVRQRVEILKALYRQARVLVLDEPTTNLTPGEVDELFSSLRAIVDEGMSVVLITHKIRETMQACDAMTVMREGEVVHTTSRPDTDPDQLARRMVGEHDGSTSSGTLAVVTGAIDAADVADTVESAGASGADTDSPAASQMADSPSGGLTPSRAQVRVRVTGLSVDNDHGVPAVRDLDLELVAGEVLGIAGVAGNGQVEMVEALAGVRMVTGGSVEVDGEALHGRPTATWLAGGVSYVPEDRGRDGILPSATLTENLVLGRHRSRARRGFIDWATVRRETEHVIADYGVKASGPSVPAGQLSGGNIQRVILARAFAHEPRLLLLHNPTRGLDIRSTQFVYERVREATAGGCVVVLVSEDLDEVLALADRVAVIYSGSLVAERERHLADPYEIGQLMTGVGRPG